MNARIRLLRRLAPPALGLACLIGPALGRPLLREDDPAQVLALSADADRDGFVTREEIADACAKAVDGAEAEFDKDWRRKLAVYGLPPGSKALDLRAIFAATLSILDAADADGDGNVTPAELKAYAEGLDADLRPDTIQAALALDRDVDMVVSRAERDGAKVAFEREVSRIEALPADRREAALHPPRDKALATWKASTLKVADKAIALWKGLAEKNRASVGDIRDTASE